MAPEKPLKKKHLRYIIDRKVFIPRAPRCSSISSLVCSISASTDRCHPQSGQTAARAGSVFPQGEGSSALLQPPLLRRTADPYQDSAPHCEEERLFSFLGLPALPLMLCSLSLSSISFDTGPRPTAKSQIH